MAIVDIDVTGAGLMPAGEYVAVVQKLEYQVKSGLKWNQEGTQTVELEEWLRWGIDKRRLHYTLAIPGKGILFHELYVTPESLVFLKRFLRATGVDYSKSGFDPEAAVGKNIGLSIIIKEDPLYDDTNRIAKVYRV